MTSVEAKERLGEIRDMVEALAQEAAKALAVAYPSGMPLALTMGGETREYQIVKVSEPWLGAPRVFDVTVLNPRTRKVTKRTVTRIVELIAPSGVA